MMDWNDFASAFKQEQRTISIADRYVGDMARMGVCNNCMTQINEAAMINTGERDE